MLLNSKCIEGKSTGGSDEVCYAFLEREREFCLYNLRRNDM